MNAPLLSGVSYLANQGPFGLGSQPAGNARSLSVQQAPPGQQNSGQPFNQTFVVAMLDEYGQVMASDNTTSVRAFLGPADIQLGAQLSGATTVTLVNGLAVFGGGNSSSSALGLTALPGTTVTVLFDTLVVLPGEGQQLTLTTSATVTTRLCGAGSATDIVRLVCSPCAAGFYSAAAGMPCTACPEGTFKSAIGATSCLACAPGSANPRAGSFQPCPLCSPGSWSAGNASSCTVTHFLKIGIHRR